MSSSGWRISAWCHSSCPQAALSRKGSATCAIPRSGALPGESDELRVGGGGIVAPEDRAAGNEEVGSGSPRPDDRVEVDAAVDLYAHALRELAPESLDSPESVRHERLPRVAGVNCHADDEVSAGSRGHDVPHGGLGVERNARAEPEATGERDRPARIVTRLDMEGDAVATRTGDGLEMTLGLLDHEVAVEEPSPGVNERRERGEHDGTDRDLGNEPAVTHVELEDPRASSDESGDLVSESREVGRIERGHHLYLAGFAPRHSIEANGTATGAVELPADVAADLERERQLAGEAAAAMAEGGMTIGLGTGTTATYFVHALAARAVDVLCVATSPATEALAIGLGLHIVPFEGKSAPARLDLAVDGADQLAPDGWVVKGNGGAHTRERIVAASADRFVVVVSSEKLVARVQPPIPLELFRFGVEATLARIGSAELRDALPTPNGGVLADWLGLVDDPAEFAARMSEMPGVIDHGLFSPELVSEALVGRGDHVDRVPGRKS